MVIATGFAGFFVADAAVTGEHVACATATVPDQTVMANTATVGTIPGAGDVQCVTATDSTTTVPGPTTTQTIPGPTTTVTTTVTAPTTTTTPPPPPSYCGTGSYFCWSADNANWNQLGTESGNTSHWNNAISNQTPDLSANGIVAPWIQRVPAGDGTNAVQLTDKPSSINTNGGQMTSLYCASACPYHTGLGESTWYHLRVRYPTAYRASQGKWNITEEWHSDGSCGLSSPFLGVQTDYTSPPTNPRLVFLLRAGTCSNPTENELYLPGQPLLQYNHWYDVLIHYRFDYTCGTFEWFVDTQQAYSNNCVSTLHQHSDGTPDSLTFGIYNYQLRDSTSSSSTDFDFVSIGPTRASVGG